MRSSFALLALASLLTGCASGEPAAEPTEPPSDPGAAIAQVAQAPPAAQVGEPGATPPAPPSTYRWLQLGADGALVVRAVAEVGAGPGTCPTVELASGNTSPMDLRWSQGSTPDPDWPVIVCEKRFDAATYAADKPTAVTGFGTLPAFGGTQRLLALGDTGCRNKEQCCTPPSRGGDWPFVDVATAVAAKGAGAVGLHVGDYLYRESSHDKAGCPTQSDSYGDFWDAWELDFFAPGQTLLSALPMIFVRGNHEACAPPDGKTDCGNPATRGWNGWFRFFDDAPYTGTCTVQSADWTARLGDAAQTELLVVDTSLECIESGALDGLKSWKPTGGTGLLATHVPLWGLYSASSSELGELPGLDAADLSHVRTALTGHIHAVESISFESSLRRPDLFVLGNGGTHRDSIGKGDPYQWTSAKKDAKAKTWPAFGYAEWDLSKPRPTLLDLAGTPLPEQ